MNISVKHIWFDFSETITRSNNEAHARLRHAAYAEIIGRPVTPELVREYDALIKKHKSHSAVFMSLGKPAGFWSERISSYGGKDLLRLADPESPKVFQALKKVLPISIFSNVRVRGLLPVLGIDPMWFTHILGPDEIKNPKPALEGFYRMVELSGVPSENILYIGDSMEKELMPAKSVGVQTGLMWSESPEVDYSFKNFDDILQVPHI